MASNQTVKPKGILKHSSSLDQRDGTSKEMSWDEMNILATHHPSDKDYGHMKIDEPPTPYSKYSDVEEDDLEGERRGSVGENTNIDPNSLASRLSENSEPKVLCHAKVVSDSDDDDDDDEQEVDQEQRHNFELKRKIHYNEYQAVQLAKKLMSEEEDDDDDEDYNVNSSDKMDQSSHDNNCENVEHSK